MTWVDDAHGQEWIRDRTGETAMGERPGKTVLSSSQRAAMRDLLAEDRERTVAQIAALTRDWDDLVEASALVGNDDEHDPEGATIAFERSHLQALLDRARAHLDDLDEVAGRLRRGTYGVCDDCGRPIALERLKARPIARTCIECAARGR
ncbi:TraR/DksA C4-type zinc finger protein [Streptosporangium sp. NPDC049046]|uniref:TraR/DksA family transcriptional regulator n=1 Tax=Streptosporangium sp. NPDC049046 TaxID=3155031 RepID=UPI003447E111